MNKFDNFFDLIIYMKEIQIYMMEFKIFMKKISREPKYQKEI